MIDVPLFKAWNLLLGCHYAALDPEMKLPNIYRVPLKDEEQCSWQEFKIFADRCPPLHELSTRSVDTDTISISLDHPIVKVVGDFAIAAFNEACQLHVKKDEHNNLHDYEIMECKYIRFEDVYIFYLTIEAIEEGNLGVYTTKVVCDNYGKRTLIKFRLTDRTPLGRNAMAVSHLSRMTSIYESGKGLVKDIEICLGTTNKGKQKGKVATESSCSKKPMYQFTKWTRMSQACGMKKDNVDAELIQLKNRQEKAMEGLREGLNQETRSLFSQDCNRTTNEDDWFDVTENFYSGMLLRSTSGTTFRGYNFQNPMPDFGFYLWF